MRVSHIYTLEAPLCFSQLLTIHPQLEQTNLPTLRLMMLTISFNKRFLISPFFLLSSHLFSHSVVSPAHLPKMLVSQWWQSLLYNTQQLSHLAFFRHQLVNILSILGRINIWVWRVFYSYSQLLNLSFLDVQLCDNDLIWYSFLCS